MTSLMREFGSPPSHHFHLYAEGLKGSQIAEGLGQGYQGAGCLKGQTFQACQLAQGGRTPEPGTNLS